MAGLLDWVEGVVNVSASVLASCAVAVIVDTSVDMVIGTVELVVSVVCHQ